MKSALELTAAERAHLLRYVRAGSCPQSLVLRSRIVLACADGASNAEVARQLAVTAQTVGRWRARFVRDRIAGLMDRPRSGAPRVVSDTRVAEVVTATVVDLCPSGSRWSKRSMAAHTGLSPSTVGRIWRSYGLKPHLFRASPPVSSPDPFLGVAELVALYRDPPERMLAMCIIKEEAAPQQEPGLGMVRERAAAVRESLDSRGILGTTGNPRLAGFLRELHSRIPSGVGIHLICDNHLIEQAVVARRWQLTHPRFHLHFTPTSQFWSNLVELKLIEMAARELRRGTENSLGRVEAALRRHGKSTRPFRWLRDHDHVLAALAVEAR